MIVLIFRLADRETTPLLIWKHSLFSFKGTTFPEEEEKIKKENRNKRSSVSVWESISYSYENEWLSGSVIEDEITCVIFDPFFSRKPFFFSLWSLRLFLTRFKKWSRGRCMATFPVMIYYFYFVFLAYIENYGSQALILCDVIFTRGFQGFRMLIVYLTITNETFPVQKLKFSL